MASSVFIKHTLKTLYSDLEVELKRVSILTNPDPKPGSSSSDAEGGDQSSNSSSGARREKALFVGLCVRGTARVSGAPGEWEV